VKFVAWTTTPWTLPANLAIAVHPEFEYLKLKDKSTDEIYILAACRLKQLYKKEEDYEIIEKYLGKDLEGIEYVPLFDYYEDQRANGCFKVLCGKFITDENGTGIVHIAPAYGEEDYAICCKEKIIKADSPADPLDDDGNFMEPVKEFFGMYVKDADEKIMQHLKAKGRLLSRSKIKHRYPFCWRSETPLIYKAVKSWFIGVT